MAEVSVWGSMIRYNAAFWGESRPKGVIHRMTADSIIESLLNGDNPSNSASLYAALENIQPPQLCKLTLAMLAANHRKMDGVMNDIAKLQKDVEAVGKAPSTYLAKLGTYLLNGTLMAIMLMVLKRLNVL